MYTLLYTSVATDDMDSQELGTLLREARSANEAVGITGMLLYKGGNFLQLLEGEQAAVLRLSQRIARDARHERMFTLLAGEIGERQFPDWSMAFQDLGNEPLRGTPGFSTFMETKGVADASLPCSDRANRLMQAFRAS